MSAGSLDPRRQIRQICQFCKLATGSPPLGGLKFIQLIRLNINAPGENSPENGTRLQAGGAWRPRSGADFLSPRELVYNGHHHRFDCHPPPATAGSPLACARRPTGQGMSAG